MYLNGLLHTLRGYRERILCVLKTAHVFTVCVQTPVQSSVSLRCRQPKFDRESTARCSRVRCQPVRRFRRLRRPADVPAEDGSQHADGLQGTQSGLDDDDDGGGRVSRRRQQVRVRRSERRSETGHGQQAVAIVTASSRQRRQRRRRYGVVDFQCFGQRRLAALGRHSSAPECRCDARRRGVVQSADQFRIPAAAAAHDTAARLAVVGRCKRPSSV